jgi:cytochrome c peroxidase
LKQLILVLALACSSKNHEKPARDDAGGRVTPPADAAAVVLPQPAPVPDVPLGLPALPTQMAWITPASVAFGELLFHDPRLSSTGKTSCATCHEPARGFSGRRGETAAGKPNLRRPSALVNLAWQRDYGWDGRFPTVIDQLPAHLRGQMGDDMDLAISHIDKLPVYRAHLDRAMANADVQRAPASIAFSALSAYVLTRYAGDTPFDREERSPTLPADVKAGYAVFTGKAQCAVCHTPPLYTDLKFHRLGLIASKDEGRGRVEPAAQGAFRTPTLRGAAARDGFFHDGSAESLDAAIDWHLAGGTGQGADPAIIDPALKKVTLTAAERAQLGAFVRALTSTSPAPAGPKLP